MASMAEDDCPPMSVVFLDSHSYSHVVFSGVNKCYAPGADLTCKYVLSEHIQPRPKDWLGIFKVGWTTVREYYTFVWAPSPKGSETEQQLVIKAYYLPKDEADYQFVYVDQDGVVRGASGPFQFRVEMEDDIVMVSSLGEVEALEGRNRKLLQENLELKERCELLLKESADAQALLKTQEIMGDSQSKIEELQCKNGDLQSKNGDLQSKNGDLQSMIGDLQSKNSDLQSKIEELQSKIEELQSKNVDLQSKSKDLESQIADFQRQNTDLQIQKANVAHGSELRAALVSAKEENEKLLFQKQELQKRVESLMNREQKLELKVKSLKEEEETLTGKYRSCESQRNQLKEQFQKVRTEKEHMENNLRTTLDRIDMLQVEKEDLKKEIEKMHDDSQVKTKHLEDLARDLHTEKEYGQQLKVRLRQDLEAQLQQERQEAKQREAVLQHELNKKALDFNHMSKKVDDVHNLLRIREMEKQDLILENQKLKKEPSHRRNSTQTPPSSLERPRDDDFSENSGLFFGNPYQPESLPRTPKVPVHTECPFCGDNIPEGQLTEHLQTAHTLCCQVCGAVYQDSDRQIYNDHVMCHALEDQHC